MSPIRYHGGKSYLAPKLRELFPGTYTRYAEPYFGGGSVLFSGDGYNVSEYVNDIYKELMNFWSVLRDPVQFRVFHRMVTMTPYGKPIFNDAALIKAHPVNKALAFFVRNRMSRQGLDKDYCTPTGRLRSGMNEHVSAWLGAIDGLPEVHARLKRVELRNQEAISFILELDSPDTFFYIDPPYVHATRVAGEYKHEMTLAEHETLLKVLSVIQGTFMLSGYSHPLYEKYAKLNQWKINTFDTVSHAGSGDNKAKRVETIWRNYG